LAVEYREGIGTVQGGRMDKLTPRKREPRS
jgi:hypothetical protein